MPRTALSLLAAAALGAAILAPTAAQAATPYKATIKTSTSSTEVGSVVTLSGKVTGGPVKGKQVALYWSRQGSSSFTKIGLVTLSSKGTYSKRFRLQDGGNTVFRVVKGAASGHARATTTSAPIKVFRTVYGFEVASRKSDGTSVNGTPSRGGWDVWSDHPVTFTLADRECDAFDAQAGVDTDATESSVTGAFGRVTSFLPEIYTTFTLRKDRDPAGFYDSIAPGTDFGVYASSDENSKLALTDIVFHCNTPYSVG